MSNVTHIASPLGLYYFSLRLADPRAHYLVHHIDHLRTCVSLARKARPFEVLDAVILPDQLHMIWLLGPEDTDTSPRLRQIKSSFSRHLPVSEFLSDAQKRSREKGIWQRDNSEVRLRDLADYEAHRSYMWRLPVAMGLVASPSDWKFSSIHKNGAAEETTVHSRFKFQRTMSRTA
ncbi:REP-associated tyrosine transposase [Algirhabdus cladophorae]|uniref:REP-associated tyrosine transposase n=1 Tax=Algirhabdus cladophorae TaxID=3377108 RepID=UPI003B846556